MLSLQALVETEPGEGLDCWAGAWRPSSRSLHLWASVSAVATASFSPALARGAGGWENWRGDILVSGGGPPRQATPGRGVWLGSGNSEQCEFVSSMHTSALAWGEVRARELRGRPSPQGAAVGSGSSCRRPPHTGPLRPPTAQLMTATPVLNREAEGLQGRVEGGGRAAWQPPWAAALASLPTPTWAGLSLLAPTLASVWVSLDLVPMGLWNGSSTHPHPIPHLSRETDCSLTAWLGGQRFSSAFLPQAGLPPHGLWILGKAGSRERDRPLPTESKMRGIWLCLPREAQQK